MVPGQVRGRSGTGRRVLRSDWTPTASPAYDSRISRQSNEVSSHSTSKFPWSGVVEVRAGRRVAGVVWNSPSWDDQRAWGARPRRRRPGQLDGRPVAASGSAPNGVRWSSGRPSTRRVHGSAWAWTFQGCSGPCARSASVSTIWSSSFVAGWRSRAFERGGGGDQLGPALPDGRVVRELAQKRLKLFEQAAPPRRRGPARSGRGRVGRSGSAAPGPSRASALDSRGQIVELARVFRDLHQLNRGRLDLTPGVDAPAGERFRFRGDGRSGVGRREVALEPERRVRVAGKDPGRQGFVTLGRGLRPARRRTCSESRAKISSPTMDSRACARRAPIASGRRAKRFVRCSGLSSFGQSPFKTTFRTWLRLRRRS